MSSPPLRTDPAAFGTSFVGRESELGEVEASLSSGRLVTIVGPPGVGKTRLASEVARRAHQRDHTEVWSCDLTEASGREEIVTLVARALDVPALSSDGALARLGAAIASRGRVLIVLDNFEQIVAHADSPVGVWLAIAPEARFLVTSRESLKLRGELLFELGPLSLPGEAGDLRASEAVRLFVDRTRAVRRSFALDEAEAPAVRRLVRDLDG